MEHLLYKDTNIAILKFYILPQKYGAFDKS